MIHENFYFKEHGFAGHLAEPDGGSDRAVIVVMGGEQSLLPGIKFAERFADYGITGLSGKAFDRLVIEAEVQDGVHHAGHRNRRSGTHGNKKRILHVAELLAADAFQPCKSVKYLFRRLLAYGLSVVVIVRAGLCGNSESGWHRHAQIGHFRKVCALASEQIPL